MNVSDHDESLNREKHNRESSIDGLLFLLLEAAKSLGSDPFTKLVFLQETEGRIPSSKAGFSLLTAGIDMLMELGVTEQEIQESTVRILTLRMKEHI